MNRLGQIVEGRERYWLTDGEWIGQSGSDAEGWRITSNFGDLIDGRGASELKAGGNIWAAFLGVPRWTHGDLPRDGIVRDIGFDGMMLWTPLRNSGGAGEPPQQIQIWGTQEIATLSSAALWVRACADGEFVCALAERRIWSNKRGYAVLPAGVIPASAHLVNGWLLYHTDRWLVLQHFDQAVGVVVAQAPTYSPDMVRLATGALRVAWSPNPEETNAQFHDFTPGEFLVRDLFFLDDGTQPPPPPPPPPPEKPMPVPDLSAFVRTFLTPRLGLVGSVDDTRRHSFEAVKACVIECRKTDPRWGLLEKPGGDNVDGFATDIMLYDLGDSTAQVVDVVGNAEGESDPPGNPDARKAPTPGWSVKDIRPIAQWKVPPGGSEPPPPPATTHKYDGGGNDTGTCDICGKSRFDPIHAIPESKVAHVYDGGEQDTGLCDICQKPKTDPIHGGVVPPPPPDGDQAAAIQKLRIDLMQTQAALGTARADLAQLRADFDALRVLVEELAGKAGTGTTGSFALVSDAKGEEFRTSKSYYHDHTIRLRIIKVEP